VGAAAGSGEKKELLFFAASSYSRQAKEYAQAHDISLFQFRPDGLVRPMNGRARELWNLRAEPPPPPPPTFAELAAAFARKVVALDTTGRSEARSTPSSAGRLMVQLKCLYAPGFSVVLFFNERRWIVQPYLGAQRFYSDIRITGQLGDGAAAGLQAMRIAESKIAERSRLERSTDPRIVELSRVLPSLVIAGARPRIVQHWLVPTVESLVPHIVVVVENRWHPLKPPTSHRRVSWLPPWGIALDGVAFGDLRDRTEVTGQRLMAAIGGGSSQ
jgi:hypothetical protein